jgi:protein-tyrosine phosphatase
MPPEAPEFAAEYGSPSRCDRARAGSVDARLELPGIFGSVGRDLDWPGCVNVRDLGGLAAADGTVTVFRSIVRADNVRQLTARGWVEAREYGIRTVLDLRSDCERADDASAPPDLHFAAVSLFDDFDSDAAYRAELERRLVGRDIREAYRLLYTEALDRNRAMFATALQVIANARQGGVLVHCAGGKDRTGVLAALLLRLVGVPVATVACDYERSEHRLGIRDSAPVGVIDKVIETVEAEHDSVDGFFLNAGASNVDIERLRKRLRSDRQGSTCVLR